MSDISISSPTGGVATNDPKNIPDMTAFVQQSLTDMQNKFTNMSDQMMGRMDAMSSKLDDLEKSMVAMMEQADDE